MYVLIETLIDILVLTETRMDVLRETLMGYEIINTGSRLFEPQFAP